MRRMMSWAVVVAATSAAVLVASMGAAGGAVGQTRLAGGGRAVSASLWAPAQEVPGSAALNQGGNAYLSSVSCASAGNCSAGGQYRDSSGNQQVLVVSEVHGTWRTAREVPGTAALNRGGLAYLFSMSCASVGGCTAGGYYTDSSGDGHAFESSEVNGTWGTAQEVPGTASLNQGGNAQLFSVSCARAGNCSAGGVYFDSSDHGQAFVVNKT